ncbi:MAG: hypothetical protein A2514_01010 [Gammaproteobacteria bacterium RIFOXYD12_FULL_61_37]|nr:MAG: hypothetical protein A2514_01010 [Gammaproteobacteria bacterium RIFOXYD12_FULL_61_37]
MPDRAAWRGLQCGCLGGLACQKSKEGAPSHCLALGRRGDLNGQDRGRQRDAPQGGQALLRPAELRQGMPHEFELCRHRGLGLSTGPAGSAAASIHQHQGAPFARSQYKLQQVGRREATQAGDRVSTFGQQRGRHLPALDGKRVVTFQ